MSPIHYTPGPLSIGWQSWIAKIDEILCIAIKIDEIICISNTNGELTCTHIHIRG
jgi:hypothetical protein